MLTNMREILSASQRNNSRDGITGFLIFDKTWFVQILEGERAQVTETYTRIATGHAAHEQQRSSTCAISRRGCSRTGPWVARCARPRSRRSICSTGSDRTGPARLKSAQIVALALDLQAFEQAKRQSQRLAG